MSINPRYVVLIPVAGIGTRFKAELPKQYCQLLGKMVLDWTLEIFNKIEQISQIYLIANPRDELIDKYANHPKVTIYKVGGATRSITVTNGLACINCVDNDWVLVHDAVRCVTAASDIINLINQLQDSLVGGILATRATDTIKQADHNHLITKTLARDVIYHAQTPQMFRYGILSKALNTDAELFTDESSAVEHIGAQVQIIETILPNFKITYPHDLKIAELILIANQQQE